MKVAFLVVDVQQAFFDNERYKPQLEGITEYINYVSSLFRKYKHPIIHVQHKTAGGGEGNPGFEVGKLIDQKEGDLYITKSYGNSFWKTDLEQMLKDLDVEFVLISGFAAFNCVSATYSGSIERDFNTALLQHGVAGFHFDDSRTIHHNWNIASYNTVEFMLKEKQDQ